ncbi:MAG: hypothetical protein MJY88_02565 [Bacteroidales bacterium]|nr:hypothetical protein [Bacteroidales bacterium]
MESGSGRNNYVSFSRQAAGRGARATGGWVLRSDAHSPRPASCLHRSIRRGVSLSFPSFQRFSVFFRLTFSQHFNILFNLDKAYLCLIRIFSRCLNVVSVSYLDAFQFTRLGSSEIRKGSFTMYGEAQLREFLN